MSWTARTRCAGIILTHGHEDHIGALAYLVEEGIKAPVYATALTRGLVESKLREQKLLADVTLHTITADSVVELAPFTVEFFHTTHSFPDSVGVSILTPAGRVIHTSDYRFDPTPVDGKPTEEDKLRRWGDAGVLLLLADSTNAERRGTTASESTLNGVLDEIMANAEGRVLLATFASNVGRVQQVISAARRSDRRVGVIGRSMVNNVKTAIQLGYLDIAQDELLTAGEMESLPARDVVIIATGSQGEPTSAMVRMSLGDHRQLTLREGDTVVLSATPIPGNEELFNRTLDNLFRQGANVLYHELGNVHVSGHGGQDDYLRMLGLVRPRYFIPVHGEYRHLVLHARLAEKSGMPKDHIYVVEDGQIVEFGYFNGGDQIGRAAGRTHPCGSRLRRRPGRGRRGQRGAARPPATERGGLHRLHRGRGRVRRRDHLRPGDHQPGLRLRARPGRSHQARPGDRQQVGQEEDPGVRAGEQDQGCAGQFRRPRDRPAPHDPAGGHRGVDPPDACHRRSGRLLHPYSQLLMAADSGSDLLNSVPAALMANGRESAHSLGAQSWRQCSRVPVSSR